MKIVGSICDKHPELNGLRYAQLRNDKYVPSHCPKCAVLKHKECRLRNINKYRATKKRWDDVNRLKVRAYSRKSSKKNRDVILKRVREWRIKNPEAARLLRNTSWSRWRASTISANPIWSNKFFIKEIYHLARIRSKITGYKWHVDHIVPLRSPIVCGLHVENNLQVIPST